MNEISNGAWSETDAANNAATPNGWPEGQPPSSVNDCARMMMGAVKRFWGRVNGAYVTTGATNAYVLTPAVGPAAYVAGERYSFRASFANTGPATLDIAGLGPKAIKKMTASGEADLAAGDIQAGHPVTVEYDGTDLVLVTPTATSQSGAFVATTRQVAAGAGLTGGGDLSADRTLAVGAGTGIIVNTDDVAIDKASQAQMEAGTANKVVTVDAMKWHPGVAKAWAVWNNAGTLLASQGISSITKNSTGDWTVNFSTAFSSANYAWSLGGQRPTPTDFGNFSVTSIAAGSFRFQTRTSAGAVEDYSVVCAQFFGDL